MTTDNQREQLKGYAQAVKDMSDEINKVHVNPNACADDPSLVNLDNRMQATLAQLTRGQNED